MIDPFQIDYLKSEVDSLQKLYGNPKLNAIYGAGCIQQPKILLLFMNPTAKNISSEPEWKGIRAPWIGTKNIWKLLYPLDLISKNLFEGVVNCNKNWSYESAFDLYHELHDKSVYITNLAKCTQDDARPLNNSVYRAYLPNTLEEIFMVRPQKIISFGNQVSSILLRKQIRVSDYDNIQKESLNYKNKSFDVYPTYYPVGQGLRNLNKAVERIRTVLLDH